MAETALTIDVHLDAQAWQAARAAEARRTLTAAPRSLEPLWFYDERGSDLFDAITRLPEYYPTRSERALLRAHAADIAATGADTLVELGSGTSDKTTTLLDAMEDAGHLRRYVPFDVSEETLRCAVEALSRRYPTVDFHGVVGDFHHHLGEIPGGGRRLVAFLGGTIGNFHPDQRRSFLGELGSALGPDDHLLVGIDLVKEPARIVAAYDDATGVTAEFNRNALRVLNRELDGDFDPDGFEHVARWNPDDRWIEMRLRARRHQQVRLEALDLDLTFDRGEELLTEISTKFVLDDFQADLAEQGFATTSTFVAPDDAFALVLARPADPDA